jgi:hypothetical protein
MLAFLDVIIFLIDECYHIFMPRHVGAPSMAEWVTGRRERSAVADRRLDAREPPKRGKKPYRGGVGGDLGAGASGEAKGDMIFTKTAQTEQQ